MPRLFLDYIEMFSGFDYVKSYFPYGSVLTYLFRAKNISLGGRILEVSNSKLSSKSLNQMNIKFHSKCQFWTWNDIRVTGLPNGVDHAPTYKGKWNGQGKAKAIGSSSSAPSPPREPTTSTGWLKKIWEKLVCVDKRQK